MTSYFGAEWQGVGRHPGTRSALNSDHTSSRQQRNQAEKNRRDKLNQSISTLASLVVPYTSSGKKVDKTSVLRLSANFLMRHMHLKENEQLAVPSEWCQKLLDELQGMLLVVSSSGKIIFWSENVESFLGHQQNDLLGQSLFDITHKDDKMELEQNLKPTNVNDSTISRIGDTTCRQERRSFFLRLKQRPASKSDQPQYEVFHVEGHIRYRKQQQNKIKNENGVITNESIFVAFVRSHKQRNVNDNSLFEALKEEWVTRHLLDGTIIFSDHRISYLSGYLSEEVTGNLAFTYMHQDDVRWVMIALRKMYSNSESYGWSCYRLHSKNGDYIYLKTHGFLEKDEKGVIQSFICINTLVPPEDGEKYIAEMKSIYTPMIYKSELAEPAITALVETSLNGNPSSKNDCEDLPLTPNPKGIKLAVELMLSGLPPNIRQEVPNTCDEKPKTPAQDILPIEVPNRDVGVKMSNLPSKYDRPSVISFNKVSATERTKRSPESLEETEAKRLRGDKSVIVHDTRSQIDTYSLDTNLFFSTDILDSASTSFFQFTDDDPLRIPDDATSSGLWDAPDSDLEEGVLRGHMHLENRIQSQGVQIQEIEEDLQTVPITSSHVYQDHFTHLKAEHRKQQELLKTLQQDHQRQQTREHISLRGAEQNIGV
nr:aryl hydrocarbon receptor nuclear translocator-like protein 2 [Halyomorpha halys]